MGEIITRLLRVFNGRVQDAESHARVVELVASPALWYAGHAVFAVYNAANPRDPFDPGSAFFVVPQAFGLARTVGVPVAAVVAALALE